MAGVLGGEVHWANLNPTRGHEKAGTRPVVILSRAVFSKRSGTVIATEATSQPQQAAFPLSLELESANMPKRSSVKRSQIRTLSTERISDAIDVVSPEVLSRLVDGLDEIIG